MPDSRNTSDRPMTDEAAAIRWEKADAATLSLHVSGRWKIDGTTPAADEVLGQAQSLTGLTRITVDAQQVAAWDSTLITFLLKLQTHCSQQGLAFDPQGLPSGIQGLLKLATAVPAREGARRTSEKEPFLARLGKAALRVKGETTDVLAFIGEAFLALCRFFAGRAQFQKSDLLGFIRDCG